MHNTWLLPHRFQKTGWAILIPFLILGIIITLCGIEPSHIFRWLGLEGRTGPDSFTSNADRWINNLIIIGMVIGAFLTTCSRERIEDELTMQLRQQSLMAALWINYAFVILATLFIYDLSYVLVITYDMLGFLLLFLGIFRWKLWRLGKEVRDEE
mgnify:FL=1